MKNYYWRVYSNGNTTETTPYTDLTDAIEAAKTTIEYMTPAELLQLLDNGELYICEGKADPDYPQEIDWETEGATHWTYEDYLVAMHRSHGLTYGPESFRREVIRRSRSAINHDKILRNWSMWQD